MRTQQAFQFIAQLKHLFGVGQGEATGFGHFQPAPDALEQIDPQRRFQQADLPADSLRCQVQLFAGAHNAPGLGHYPEIVQLSVIEHTDRRFVKTEVYAP